MRFGVHTLGEGPFHIRGTRLAAAQLQSANRQFRIAVILVSEVQEIPKTQHAKVNKHQQIQVFRFVDFWIFWNFRVFEQVLDF